MQKAAQLARNFPSQVKLAAIQIFTARTPSNELKTTLQRAFDELASSKRTRTTLEARLQENRLFIKSSRLTGFRSRFRTTLGIERRKCGLDWELAELLNTVRAQELQAPTARLLGFAYRKQLGLVRDFSLIFELLEHYLPSHQWLAQEVDPLPFLRSCFALFRELHEKQIYHLDLWAGNIMVDSRDESLRVVDFENCVHGATHYEPEMLGFMYGHFFQREINRHVDEPTYDRLVKESISELSIDPVRFKRTYNMSKHEKVGRKERHLLHRRGLLITG